ncbi:L,D-transpeptidase catalytic domain [Verrucomicrobium sp. GAS474]|uniref:L,D-transpeptidase n=1 Tax=Verrucomicrobium sp. GAS474 TaxID=1882831 RepID=UPI000879AAF1|nr:L,D-transpeptidase [Verrucomicrobium sp. GAS474]SDT96254.1 L,D-transpeptidase catalytic domain [Verrucomicrobium sp. GAS474]
MNTPRRLRVDVAAQRVDLLKGATVLWSAPVSTSLFGLGEEEGSNKTPRGRFRVAEKIGDGEPLGTRFVGRKPTGEVWTPEAPLQEVDWVLTRILWLEGLDPANANTKGRYVYFHGTNREDRIGTPASHGCIRLCNAEMIALFDRVAVGTEVDIVG